MAGRDRGLVDGDHGHDRGREQDHGHRRVADDHAGPRLVEDGQGGRNRGQADDRAERIHHAQQTRGTPAIGRRHHVWDHGRVGAAGQVERQLHEHVRERQGQGAAGHREQAEAQQVDRRAGDDPRPPATPARARPVAQPAGEDRRDQCEEVAGRADVADQQVCRPARDHESRDRHQLEGDRRPMRALAQPHRVDREQAPGAHVPGGRH